MAAHQAPPSLGFPGKNTGVSCHFLLQCMKVKSESEVTQSCWTQRPHGLQPTRLLRPWDFPGKSTRMGCHCLLKKKKKVCHLQPISSVLRPLAFLPVSLLTCIPFLYLSIFGLQYLKNGDFPDGLVIKNSPAMQ